MADVIREGGISGAVQHNAIFLVSSETSEELGCVI
jgi:hypothetical protein